MKTLHNRVNRNELRKKVQAEVRPRTTLSFYAYTHLEDPATFRDQFYFALYQLEVLGRIYVASEGVNAQLSLPTDRMTELYLYFKTIPFLAGIRLNVAIEDDGKSFFTLAVKVKDKIVADGIEDEKFDVTQSGPHLDAAEFNVITDDPETIVVDMRNHYESEVGHFVDAILPPMETFREGLPMVADLLQDKKEKSIVMYCTGGIRCEKASAYMKHRGFKNVFHLEGGIINYVNEAKEKQLELKFHGKNFVFDQRLGERVTEEIISQCHQCGKPADTHVNCINDACHLLFIQCDECKKKYEATCSKECQDFIHLPEEEQKKLRSGIDKGRNVFNKSKQHKERLQNWREGEK